MHKSRCERLLLFGSNQEQMLVGVGSGDSSVSSLKLDFKGSLRLSCRQVTRNSSVLCSLQASTTATSSLSSKSWIWAARPLNLFTFGGTFKSCSEGWISISSDERLLGSCRRVRQQGDYELSASSRAMSVSVTVLTGFHHLQCKSFMLLGQSSLSQRLVL